ncbi:MAG: hypothetical protein ACYT04_95040, partial [Nostoc sp.]
IQPEVEVPALSKLDKQLDRLDNLPDNSENLTAISLMASLVEKMMGYIGNRRCLRRQATHTPNRARSPGWGLAFALAFSYNVNSQISSSPRVLFLSPN